MNNFSTRQKILNTAISVFAKKGYSGTTMDYIAEIADVNKAAIYYHVGNKKRLYTTVLRDFITKNRKLIKENIIPSDNTKDNLRNVLRLLNNSPEDQRAVFRIIFREIASGWATLPPEIFEDISEVFHEFREIIRPGIEKKGINEKDPLITHIYIFSSILLLNNMPEIRKKLMQSGFFPLIQECPHETEIENYIDIIINGFFAEGDI